MMMQPGDFILVEGGNSIVDRVIRLGQWLRHKDRPGRRFTHAALIVDELGSLVEAEGRGICTGNIAAYKGRCTIVPIFAPNDQRANAVKFAKGHVGDRYGFGTIFAIGIQILTGLKWTVSLDGTEICSGLVARSLERCGYDFTDPFDVTPADLAVMFKVLPT